MDLATWCALAERHGAGLARWPAGAAPTRRRPAVASYAEQHGAAVAFHAWLQWLLDVQLPRRPRASTVIQDLPIGVAGGGADAWAWQDVLAEGVTVGAPPDAFNPRARTGARRRSCPWRLRAADYEPFIETIRATMPAPAACASTT